MSVNHLPGDPSGPHDGERRGCGGCGSGDCPMGTAVTAPALDGKRFVLASLAVFIGPLLLAIAGAIGWGSTVEGQLVGAASGLVLGGLLGGLCVMFLARKETR